MMALALAERRTPNKGKAKIGGDLDSEVKYLPVSELSVDPRVNTRPLNPAWVAQRVDQFDPGSVQLIHVSERADGTLSVIDGQHRLALIRGIGYGDQLVECKVYRGLSVAEEAAKFRKLNDTRKPGRMHEFKAGLTANDPECIAINNIVQSVGLCVHEQAGRGHITCISVLQKLYRGDTRVAKKPDPRCILHALECISQAWGPESTSFRGTVVHGLGLVFLREGTRVNAKDMATKLALVPAGAAGLEGKARNAKDIHNRGLPFAAAGVITDIYNKGRKSNLLQSWWGA